MSDYDEKWLRQVADIARQNKAEPFQSYWNGKCNVWEIYCARQSGMTASWE